jgi:hypothetical protein
MFSSLRPPLADADRPSVAAVGSNFGIPRVQVTGRLVSTSSKFAGRDIKADFLRLRTSLPCKLLFGSAIEGVRFDVERFNKTAQLKLDFLALTYAASSTDGSCGKTCAARYAASLQGGRVTHKSPTIFDANN